MQMECSGHQVEVTARRNCKRFILRWIPAEGKLTLSVPLGATPAQVRTFLDARRDWVATHAQVATYVPRFSPGEHHLLMGRYVVLGRDLPASEAALTAARDHALADCLRTQLSVWSSRMNVQPGEVRLRTMQSRWGSCNVASHAITMNRRLAQTPPELIESVLVHELCHLLHPDHSSAFYRDLTSYLPDAKERKRLLDSFSFDVLPPEEPSKP